MNNRISMPPVMARRVLLLVAIFAALTPLSLYLVSVTRAQTGTSAGLAAPALTATASGATAIDLNWPSVSGAARYDLRRGGPAPPAGNPLNSAARQTPPFPTLD